MGTGLDFLGADDDAFSELRAEEQRRAAVREERQRQAIEQMPRFEGRSLGQFLWDAKWWILGLGAAALAGVWLLSPRRRDVLAAFAFADEPTPTERRRTQMIQQARGRSYQAIGASPRVRESALRVVHARELEAEATLKKHRARAIMRPYKPVR